MISCEKARELTNAYIDGALTETESCEYEEHISCCEVCHEEYDMLKRIVSDLAKTGAPVPDGFAKNLHMALVAEQNKTKKKSIFAFPYYKAASVMAAALVIAVVGKVGVYDTYKKVMDDTAAVTEEIGNAAEPAIDIPVPSVIEEKIEPVQNTTEKKETYKYTEKRVEEAEIQLNEQAEEYSAPVEEPPVLENNSPLEDNNNISVISEDLLMDETVDTAEPTAENIPSVARMITPEDNTEEVDLSDSETVEAAMDKAVSGGGGGSSASVDAVTELIPAEVIIHPGDGSMIMFKKYLLTILDGSKITDNNGTITITVSADEYESVMDHIRSNEYVKSVSEGTPFEGEAIINIK